MKNRRFLTCLLALCLLSSTSSRVLGQIPPPQVAAQNPPAGSLLLDLSQINVIFNASVVGVEASDLRINGSPATSIVTNNPNDFTFIFPPQPDGPVNVEWIDGHGITDRNEPPTPFAGGQWSYVVSSVIAEDKKFIISEFLANNQVGIVDDDAERSDWIEISNRGTLPATLDGWFLTDSASNLGKWRFPDGLSPIPSRGFLVVWASSKNRTNTAAPLHTNFRLSSSPSFLALVNPQSNIVSFFSPYPTQQRDISYGRDVDNPTSTGFFTIPTPGRTNSTSGAGFAPQVLISLDSGVFTNQSISLSMSAPSGVIRYTTNGSIPLTNSPVYTTPLTFSGSAILKARVFPAQGSGLLPGPVEARNYVLLDTNVVNFTSKLPILVMSTSGRGISADVISGSPRVEGTFLVMDTGLDGRSSFSGQPQFLGNAGYEIFGQTSAGFAKPPYRIEVHDAMGEDLDIPLLGLPAEADWKLRNPFNDKTVMNDFLAYELFDLMGNYAPRRRYVEVFVDTGGGKLRYPQDYLGVMFLFETIKAGNNRVDIQRLGPLDTAEPDITGGYIFKKDKVSPNDLDFTTTGAGNLGFPGQALKLHEPRPIELRTTPSSTRLTPSGSNQLGFLVRYLNRMERALYATNWLSLTGTNHYSHYLDIDSFVDFHWLVEFTKQIDGVRLSTYFHKDRGGKVKAGPVWDWNLSFGNADYLRGGQTNGWYYAEEDQGMTANEHIWLRRLINGAASMGAPLADGSGNGPGPGGDPDFNQKIADRWGILRINLLNATNLWGRIDQISSFLDESVARDLWGKYRAEVVGVDLWPNPDGTADGRDVDYAKPLFYRGTTANSIIGQMKKWVHGRYLWIDGQFARSPSLSAPGGRVTPGTTVTLTPASGTVMYYTLDGSDPRQPGGMVASGVMSNSSPVTLTIDANTWVFARAYRTGSWYRTWSPPESASYITSIPGLRVTELMYHPAAPGLADTNSPEAFEFVEIANLGTTSISLGGSRIRGEVSFVFPPINLAPASRVVVVANTNAFRLRYPDPAIVVAGQYEGSLNNSRGRVVFTGPAGESIHDFEYSDDWGKTTDGFGFSLVIRSENTALEDWGLSSNWRAGSAVDGTPGRAEPTGGSVPEVVVNEASTRSEDTVGDQVELHNPTSQPANIGGWFLSDDPKTPFKYRIPDGTIIAPGGYWTVAESVYGSGPQGFSLSSMGDDIYLFAANAAGNLLGYSHGFQFGAQLPGQSFGRLVLPNQSDEFVSQSSPTLGTRNAAPRIGPVVVSEVHYRPPDVFRYLVNYDNDNDEFVELQNLANSPVQLFDTARPTNIWRLRDAISFRFPSGVTIPAGGFLLVVGFDPSDVARLESFRTRFGVPSNVPVFGPWSGKLDNSSGRVELVMPAPPLTDPENLGIVTEVIVDRARYSDDTDPRLSTADGLGASLHRSPPDSFGGWTGNWIAAAPNPGAASSAENSPRIASQPEDLTLVATNVPAVFRVSMSGAGPFRYQWIYNGKVIPGAESDQLTIPNVQPPDAGIYQVIASGSGGSVESRLAHLAVIPPLQIVREPVYTGVQPGRTNTVTVGAASASSISYQWYLDGNAIPGATNAALKIGDRPGGAQLSEDGLYHVLLTDSVSSVLTPPVRVAILVNPNITVPPQPQTVIRGGSAVLSVVVSNTVTLPLGYRWRRGTQTVQFQSLNSRVSFFVLTNVLSDTNVSVQITNLANRTGLLSPVAQIRVVADSDGDGIPDEFEALHPGKLNANDPTDGDQDADGDTMSNKAEYIAGTNPSDPQSYLRVSGVDPEPVTLTFRAEANRTYAVQYTDELGSGLWTTLQGIPSRPDARVETVTDPSPGVNRLYRLLTPFQ